jgi:hypothetical protein
MADPRAYAAVTNAVAGSTAERPATEMEALGGNLADTARRLEHLADKLQSRVDGFISAATPMSAEVEKTPPSPPPGTLGCIKFYHKKIDAEAERIDSLLITLSQIL